MRETFTREEFAAVLDADVQLAADVHDAATIMAIVRILVLRGLTTFDEWTRVKNEEAMPYAREIGIITALAMSKGTDPKEIVGMNLKLWRQFLDGKPLVVDNGGA